MAAHEDVDGKWSFGTSELVLFWFSTLLFSLVMVSFKLKINISLVVVLGKWFEF